MRYTIFSTNDGSQNHRFLIKETLLIRVVTLPKIVSHRFLPPFIPGTFFVSDTSIPVIDFLSFIKNESVTKNEGFQDLYIFEYTKNRFLAITNVTLDGYVEEEELHLNKNYEMTSQLEKSSHDAFMGEYARNEDESNRFFLVNLDYFPIEFERSLRIGFDEELARVRSLFKKITAKSSQSIIQPFTRSERIQTIQERTKVSILLTVRVGKFLLAIPSVNILNITKFDEKYEPYSYISNDLVGLKKTQYGNSLIYDLNVYLNSGFSESFQSSDISNKVEILLDLPLQTTTTENSYLISLLIDEVMDYHEYEIDDIKRTLFPLTHTSNSIYSGYYKPLNDKIFLVLDMVKLKEDLGHHNFALLGQDSAYQVPLDIQKQNLQEIDLSIGTIWFGTSPILGILNQQVLNVEKWIHGDANVFSNSVYEEVPLIHLAKLFGIPQDNSESVIIVKSKEKIFGLVVPGHDLHHKLSDKIGGTDSPVLRAIFARDNHYIESLFVDEKFIGFRLNLENLSTIINFSEYQTHEVETIEKDVIGEFIIYNDKKSDLSKSMILKLEDLKGLERAIENDEIYEITAGDTKNQILISKRQAKSQEVVFQINTMTQNFTFPGDFDVVTLYSGDDEYSNYLEINHDLLVTLTNTEEK